MYKHSTLSNQTRKAAFLVLIMLVWTIAIYGAAQETPARNTADVKSVLEKTGLYCETLKEAVFHFFCRERIFETVEKAVKYPSNRRGIKNFLEGDLQRRERSRYSSINGMRQRRLKRNYDSQRRLKKNNYVHDYQIIKHNNSIREQRMLRSVNGKKSPEGTAAKKTFLYSYKNAVTPIRLFAREHQNRYDYKLIGTKKLKGRDNYIIEVTAKDWKKEVAGMKDKDGKPITEPPKLVVAWIDCDDYSIAKLKVFPIAIKGYGKLLNIDKDRMNNLEITDVHYFSYARKGIRYPTKTQLTLSFNSEQKNTTQIPSFHREKSQQLGGIIFTKIQTEITYDKYLFYGVSVDAPVFKDLDQHAAGPVKK